MSVLKVVHPRVRTGPRGMSEIELALVKLVGVSKKFCLLDVVAPSHGIHGAGLTIAHAGERATRVPAFDNLDDDSSPDVHKTHSPKKVGEKGASG
jgi:hypothetical protein